MARMFLLDTHPTREDHPMLYLVTEYGWRDYKERQGLWWNLCGICTTKPRAETYAEILRHHHNEWEDHIEVEVEECEADHLFAGDRILAKESAAGGHGRPSE